MAQESEEGDSTEMRPKGRVSLKTMALFSRSNWGRRSFPSVFTGENSLPGVWVVSEVGKRSQRWHKVNSTNGCTVRAMEIVHVRNDQGAGVEGVGQQEGSGGEVLQKEELYQSAGSWLSTGATKRRLTKRKTDRTFGRKTFLGAAWYQNHSLPVFIWENYGEDKACGGRLRSFLLRPQLLTAREQAMSQLKNTEWLITIFPGQPFLGCQQSGEGRI